VAAVDAQITASFNADHTIATFTVTNTSPLCDPADIGFAVYVKSADGFVTPQTLSDSDTGTISSGSKTLTISIPNGVSPNCFTQFDAFIGPVLPQITDTQQYRDRLRAYDFGQTPSCVEAESITASTPTSSASSTSTSTSTTSSTIAGIAVNGSSTSTTGGAVVLESSTVATLPTTAAVQVEAVALPRTGAQYDAAPLLLMAGLLLCLGGALLAWTARPDAPRL
jgi:hypothetical protein